MIKPINFYQFTQAGIIQSLVEVVNVFESQHQIEALPDVLQNKLTLLKDKLSEVDASFKPKTKSEFTLLINEKDELRKNIQMMFYNIAKNYRKHWEPSYQLAAHRVIDTVNTYGKDIHRKNYLEETAILNQLTNDILTNSERLADCQLLNIESLLVKLAEVNNEFNDLWRQRQNASAHMSKLRPVSEVLEEAKLLYVELVNVLNALLTLSSTPSLQQIAVYHNSYKDKLLMSAS